MQTPTIPPSSVPGLMHPDLYVQDPNAKAASALTHNCVQKTILSGVMGFGMGGLFGGFMASMAYDTPFQNRPPPAAAGAGAGPAKSTTPSSTAVPAAASTATPRSASTSTLLPPTPANGNHLPPAPRVGVVAAAVTATPPTTLTTTTTTTTPATAAPLLATAPPPTPSHPPVTVPPPRVAPTAATATATATFTATSTNAASAVSAMTHPTPTVATLSTRQTIINGFRDMGSRSFSTAKSFGKVGAIYSGIECGIEGLRGRNDITNGVAAGCLTGGILAMNAGPIGAASGCAAFAAFSAAIEAWIRSPESEY